MLVIRCPPPSPSDDDVIYEQPLKHQFCSNTFNYKPSRARIRIFIPQYSHQWQIHHIFCLTCSRVVLLTTDFISSTITLSVLALLHQKSLATSSFSVNHRGTFLVPFWWLSFWEPSDVVGLNWEFGPTDQSKLLTVFPDVLVSIPYFCLY